MNNIWHGLLSFLKPFVMHKNHKWEHEPSAGNNNNKKPNNGIGKNMPQKAISINVQRLYLWSVAPQKPEPSMAHRELSYAVFTDTLCILLSVRDSGDVWAGNSYACNYVFADCGDDRLATACSAPCCCVLSEDFTGAPEALRPFFLYFWRFFSFQGRWNIERLMSEFPRAAALLRHSSITSAAHELPQPSEWGKAFLLARSPKIILKTNLVQATSIPSLLKQAMELPLLLNTSRFLWNIKMQNHL